MTIKLELIKKAPNELLSFFLFYFYFCFDPLSPHNLLHPLSHLLRRNIRFDDKINCAYFFDFFLNFFLKHLFSPSAHPPRRLSRFRSLWTPLRRARPWLPSFFCRHAGRGRSSWC